MTKLNVSYQLKRFYVRFLRIRGEPRNIALGLALGLFIGMSPTMGFQMVIAAFIAALLKWNKISAALGVWITNPITAPFIYSLTYYAGSRLYGMNKAYVPPDEMTISIARKILAKSPGIFYSLTIGGMVIGLPLAIAGYFISYYLISRYRENIKLKIERQKERLKERAHKVKAVLKPEK